VNRGMQIKTDCRGEVYRAAKELYSLNPSWVTFFREILGLRGIIHQKYPTRELLDEFKRTGTYAEILQLLAKLRQRRDERSEHQEPSRVITVRLPKSLHEAIRVEAHEHRTSMNQLCISKLLQFIDGNLVPND
jgi:predicted HicB family RNase H-like nuclease